MSSRMAPPAETTAMTQGVLMDTPARSCQAWPRGVAPVLETPEKGSQRYTLGGSHGLRGRRGWHQAEHVACEGAGLTCELHIHGNVVRLAANLCLSTRVGKDIIGRQVGQMDQPELATCSAAEITNNFEWVLFLGGGEIGWCVHAVMGAGGNALVPELLPDPLPTTGVVGRLSSLSSLYHCKAPWIVSLGCGLGCSQSPNGAMGGSGSCGERRQRQCLSWCPEPWHSTTRGCMGSWS